MDQTNLSRAEGPIIWIEFLEYLEPGLLPNWNVLHHVEIVNIVCPKF
ncbi:hypothetical protein [Flagellimonas sp. 2504JD1-5]